MLDRNTIFQKTWFGPFGISKAHPEVETPRHASPVYDVGPLDGLRTASMWAWQMSALPPRMGQQALCPPGQIPYGPPGRVQCTQAGAFASSPTSVPNRRTFEVGPWWAASHSGMAGARMGDETLSPTDRDALLQVINAASEKVPALDSLVSYSNDYDRNLTRALGTDATRFFALSNSIAPLYPTVQAVLDRMYEPEPALWATPTADEAAAVRQWTTGVNEMYKIFVAHKDVPLVLPPNIPAPPGFTNTSTAPATQRIVVEPMTYGPTTPPTENVLSTQNLLLGGGIAVAFGILLYAIS
jgi:hypothetical protein